MNRPTSAVIVVAVGLVALAVAGPALVKLANALVPLILVAGIVVGVLRVVWAYTQR